jgi:hypothetical protein
MINQATAEGSRSAQSARSSQRDVVVAPDSNAATTARNPLEKAVRSRDSSCSRAVRRRPIRTAMNLLTSWLCSGARSTIVRRRSLGSSVRTTKPARLSSTQTVDERAAGWTEPQVVHLDPRRPHVADRCTGGYVRALLRRARAGQGPQRHATWLCRPGRRQRQPRRRRGRRSRPQRASHHIYRL